MTQSSKDVDKVFPFNSQQELTRSLYDLHMRDKAKINDYIQAILEILHEFELKE